MNQRTTGAVSGAVSGAKVGGPWGAVVGGILGAARAGHAGQALAEQLGRNNDGTLKTPAQQMLTPQEQLWGGNEDDGTDMLSLTPEDEANIAQGIDNGFGEWE
jgi:outer membrane lipoprotein SlyB